MLTLYPLDHRGPYLALFFFFLAAEFTVLLLHFSPLATFDALGPQLSLPVVCTFFFSSSLSFFLPLGPLSLFLSTCPSSPLPVSSLPSVWGSEAAWLHGNRPYTSCPPPTVRSVQAAQTQSAPSSPPPSSSTTPLQPSTATISPLQCVYLMCPQ